MHSKLPPVPAENLSPKGTGADPVVEQAVQGHDTTTDPDKIGQPGNSKVNTVHQGHQQDR